jgi:hypothetical protein
MGYGTEISKMPALSFKDFIFSVLSGLRGATGQTDQKIFLQILMLCIVRQEVYG